jgi:hypothetical protein
LTDFEANLSILKNILIEKQELLNIILNITINQESTLLEEEPPALFYEMNDIKQIHINKIVELDTNFNNIFLKIPDFEDKSKTYLDKIKELQQLIKIVTDLDLKIRVAEETNKKYANKLKTACLNLEEKRKRAIARDLLNKYKSNHLED